MRCSCRAHLSLVHSPTTVSFLVLRETDRVLVNRSLPSTSIAIHYRCGTSMRNRPCQRRSNQSLHHRQQQALPLGGPHLVLYGSASSSHKSIRRIAVSTGNGETQAREGLSPRSKEPCPITRHADAGGAPPPSPIGVGAALTRSREASQKYTVPIIH